MLNPTVYNPILAEVFFILIGLIILANGVKALKDTSCRQRYTTAAFWFIAAVPFIAGPYIPYWMTGALLCCMAVLTAMKGVVSTKSVTITAEETRKNADKIGSLIFIPPVTLAVVSVAVAAANIVSSSNSLGVAALVGVIVVFCITKAPAKSIVTESTRMLDAMGSVALLPQMLGALGSLFTAAGVGSIVSSLMSGVIPEGNKLIAVIVYCLGMAIFTAIMGNAFAAFSVMTVGIAIPFLIMQGANPVIVGALGMTAGFCGTLLTPMAANFNIMPAALLEIEDKYVIIKKQAPFAAAMLIFHIAAMYIMAF